MGEDMKEEANDMDYLVSFKDYREKQIEESVSVVSGLNVSHG